ncbi:hypothetical protein [uncultured Algimonas sp.]|uniref:hypothetical protein n=1 Tax=uncultured Algimonas sp. TaxID=1547920 RepID=UPI002601FB82|nr:hypothetical protein [uncultured Algimonas sp.]
MRRLTIFLSVLAPILVLACQTQASDERPASSDNRVDCSLFGMRVEVPGLEKQTDCGYVDESGLLHIDAETMAFVDHIFDETGWEISIGPEYEYHPPHLRCLPLATSDTGFHYVYFNRQGQARPSHSPGIPMCGMFGMVSDLFLSEVDGKIVLSDEDLNIVRRSEFVFVKGLVGCTSEPTKEPVDHGKWLGGVCGHIDRNLNAIGDIEFPYETVATQSD